jgi:hypothetical protein
VTYPLKIAARKGWLYLLTVSTPTLQQLNHFLYLSFYIALSLSKSFLENTKDQIPLRSEGFAGSVVRNRVGLKYVRDNPLLKSVADAVESIGGRRLTSCLFTTLLQRHHSTQPETTLASAAVVKRHCGLALFLNNSFASMKPWAYNGGGGNGVVHLSKFYLW